MPLTIKRGSSCRISPLHWLVTAGALIGIGLFVASCEEAEDNTTNIELGESGVMVNGQVWSYRGSAMSRQIDMPQATLTTTSGADFDVRAETRGLVTLVYVGYTHCPDLCPTHMTEIARAVKELPPEAAAKVRVLFVTSDPERDTPDVLRDWLAGFDPSFIGLTGSPEELVQFQRDLGMNPAAAESHDHEQADEYNVNHASYVLAFPVGGTTALIAYPAGATSDDYLADLRKLTSAR